MLKCENNVELQILKCNKVKIIWNSRTPIYEKQSKMIWNYRFGVLYSKMRESGQDLELQIT